MSQTTQQDPKEQGQKPPLPEQSQMQHHPGVGVQAEMHPQPDYGEQSYQGSGKLTGKAAIITGADSRIGRAVALAFAREGADVLISYLDEEQDAQETERVVAEAGRKAVRVPGDISQEAHCQHLVQRALQEFGHLDILVNNAAFQMTHQAITEIPSEEFDHTFRTNIYAMFYLCKAAWPHLQPGSTIINTSSVEAYQPEPMLLAYAATKAAIVNFTKGLAKEGVQKGIRVNTVAPGPVWTPLIPASMPPEQVKEFGKQSPMQRPAQPAELAPAYVFLASQDSSYIAGETIGVTGGTPLP
jgi:NAD(P)-dependent dehydrogenase (short-subunit alcohol dehydrogenase family)